MNSSGPRIGLTTSPGMVLRLRKSKKYALVARWCSEQSPKARTLFTMFSDEPMRADICSQSSSVFLTGKGTL
jgi:hypothetical protein